MFLHAKLFYFFIGSTTVKEKHSFVIWSIFKIYSVWYVVTIWNSVYYPSIAIFVKCICCFFGELIPG